MKKHLHGPWSDRLRATAFPVALRLAKPLIWLRRRLWPHRVRLWRVESSAGHDQPLAVVGGLTDETKHFFLSRAFDGPHREVDLGTARLTDAFDPAWIRKQDCSLIVVETSQTHFRRLKQDGWFFIPIWISGTVHLPIPEEFLKRETVRSDLRKIRREQFEYEITHDEARFNDFYHHMHLPYIRKTHGGAACLDSYAEKRRLSADYDLLLVRQRGQDIAGMLIIHEPAGPRLWSLGVREDGVDHVKDGVLAALYHFSFEHLAARGFKCVNLGSSRAFLHDGVLNFKRKLSQTIAHGSWWGMAFKVSSLTPGTKDFLQKTPFVFLADEQLQGAVFTEDELSLEKIQKLEKDYLHPGLARLIIYSFRPVENMNPLSPSLAERIEIRPATDLVR
jgi:hypothetical protein